MLLWVGMCCVTWSRQQPKTSSLSLNRISYLLYRGSLCARRFVTFGYTWYWVDCWCWCTLCSWLLLITSCSYRWWVWILLRRRSVNTCFVTSDCTYTNSWRLKHQWSCERFLWWKLYETRTSHSTWILNRTQWKHIAPFTQIMYRDAHRQVIHIFLRGHLQPAGRTTAWPLDPPSAEEFRSPAKGWSSSRRRKWNTRLLVTYYARTILLSEGRESKLNFTFAQRYRTVWR